MIKKIIFILFTSSVLTVFNSSCSEEKIITPENNQNKTVVDLYGKLRIEGNKILDKNGNQIALHGMSLFWSQWIGKYYNYDCIKWLRDDWKCTVIRAAMAVDEQDGYLINPHIELSKVRKVIDACIELGIYVIVDWHSHHAEDYVTEAKSFFSQIANLYGDKPNIIYEIYNEPLQISWKDVVKPYSIEVVEAIRAVDPDNIIIVGTPTWSQDVDVAANDPLNFSNIVYALHFYAGTHKQSLRDKVTTALNKGVALFISEWGTSLADASGSVFYTETNEWINFTDSKKMSWCNWSVADKNETTSALRVGANAEGGWSLSELTESGKLVRKFIIARNDPIFKSLRY